MKLFTPQEAKQRSNSQRDADVAQVAYLTVTLQKLQNSINKEQVNFNSRMEEQRVLYAEEKARLQKELNSLNSDITAREEHRAVLLAPVELLPIKKMRKEAEDMLLSNKQRSEELVELEEGIVETQQQLADKLDQCSEREAILLEREKRISSREKGSLQEQAMIASRHKNLNDLMESFKLESTEKQRTLEMRENALIAREKMTKEYIDSRTKELNNRERVLNDRRAAFERAYSELIRKQNESK